MEITLKIPMGWLGDSKRKYPVYVDPAVGVNPSDDADPWEENPNWIYDAVIYMTVQSELNSDRYGLLKFPLPTYILPSQVTDARLMLYKDFGSTGSEDRIISLYEANSDSWDESTVTWNNYGGYNPTVLASLSPIYGAGYKYFIDSNLKNAVASNMNSDDVISLVVKDGFDDSSTRYTQYFYASGSSDPSKYPELTVYYDPTAPTSSITAPPSGSTQLANFPVSVTDYDEYGISSCKYRVESNGGQTKPWTLRTCSSSVTITVGSSMDCPDVGTNICTVFVRATDNIGNVGSGDSRPFTIAVNNPPNTPTPYTPADDAIVTTVTPAFDWSSFSDPNPGDTQAAYHLRVWHNTGPNTDGDFKVLDKEYSSSSSSATPTSGDYISGGLVDGENYHWHVRVRDNYGAWSGWSADTQTSHMDFTVSVPTNSPPNTPSSPSPANGATDVSIYADLSWSGGDPDPEDTVTYDVYFGTSSSPPYVGTTLPNTPSYDPGVLSYTTIYYWKIVAKDDKGAINEGPEWSFMTVSSGGGGETPRIVGDVRIKNNFNFLPPVAGSDLIECFVATGDNRVSGHYMDATVTADVSNPQNVQSAVGMYSTSEETFSRDYSWQDADTILDEIDYYDKNTFSSLVDLIVSGMARGGTTIPISEIIEKGGIPTPGRSNLYLDKIDLTSLSGGPPSVKPVNDRIPTIFEACPDIFPDQAVGRLASPADVLITDPKGRRVGMLYENGNLVGEINENPEYVYYSGDREPEFIIIDSPEEGNYNVEIIGTASGNFDFNLTRTTGSNLTVNISIVNKPINAGEIFNFTVFIPGSKRRAEMVSLLHESEYSVGENLYSLVYVENTGAQDIDDKVMMVIKDPIGKKIYESYKRITLEAGESRFMRFDWEVQQGLAVGAYIVKFGFADPDIVALPSFKSFRIQ